MTHFFKNQFETPNWLNVIDRSSQSLKSIVFKYLTDQYSSYSNDIFQSVSLNNSREKNSYLKLICLLEKINIGALSEQNSCGSQKEQ